MEKKELKIVHLGPQHQPTGKTVHRIGTKPIPTPSTLRILQYVGDACFYLMYYDASDEEMTDTYHETLEAAMSQAEFEFGVMPNEWSEL